MTSDASALIPASDSTPEGDHRFGGLDHDVSGGISAPVLGMLLFITSEVMFFSGLFAAYFSVRANSTVGWPPPNPETGAPFHVDMLPLVLPATIILIISSVTCQWGIWAIRQNDHTRFVRAFAVTMILGAIFLIMQALDYWMLGQEQVTLASGTFGTTYFTLTGFHGAHVFGGVIMLSVVTYRGILGQFSSKHHDAAEAASLYWHFVDVVWILLFSLLYLFPGNAAPH
jgi:cytochrome c oxidase subunit 3